MPVGSAAVVFCSLSPTTAAFRRLFFPLLAPAGVAANPSAEAEKANPNYAVVDTNAIIKGMRLEQLGAQAVTIQEARKPLFPFAKEAAAERQKPPLPGCTSASCL